MVGEDLPIESIAKRIVPALAKKNEPFSGRKSSDHSNHEMVTDLIISYYKLQPSTTEYHGCKQYQILKTKIKVKITRLRPQLYKCTSQI